MERVFLRALADDPRDDQAREIYADWLEEQASNQTILKAAFLRKSLTWARLPARQRADITEQLHDLAAALPGDWLAQVSRAPIENCPAVDKALTDLRADAPFYFRCDRNWEDLQPTETAGLRVCDACRTRVQFCSSLKTARQHARHGYCVALSAAVVRHGGDLAPDRKLVMVGMVHPDQPLRRSQMRPRRRR